MKLYKLRLVLILISFVTQSCSQQPKDCSDGVFQERNGLVVFEAEDTSLSDGWSLQSKIEDYSGEGYITWVDSTTTETDGQGLLSYKIRISKPEIYTLKFRNYPSCEDFRACNDVFVKVHSGDWQKNFNHTLSNWDWNFQQDIDHVFSNSEFFLNKGEHTLSFSGRSQDFSIDKIALYHKRIKES
jgi:hypothetical protein